MKYINRFSVYILFCLGCLWNPLCTEIFASAPIEAVATEESLSNYLKQVHGDLKSLRESGKYPKETIHLVLGNQSADMDSIASAIALAHAKSSQGFYVPIINIPQEDLCLRADVLHVLATLNIDPLYLLYKKDLDFLQKLAQQGKVRITLVDHNHLTPDQEAFADCVEKIIDHHVEENCLYPLLDNKEKTIVKTGSNATLVTKELLSETHLSSQDAYLLLSAILLDTGNLKNKDTTTKTDTEIASVLKELAGEYYQPGLFDLLIKKRNAVEHLSPELLLKRDYKSYKGGKLLYGIAGIPKSVLWTSENRSEWKGSLKQSLENQYLHFMSAMAHDGSDRVWIVYIPDTRLEAAFLAHIHKTPELNEKLRLKSHFPKEGLSFFALKDQIARKQLQPLLSFEANTEIQNLANY